MPAMTNDEATLLDANQLPYQQQVRQRIKQQLGGGAEPVVAPGAGGGPMPSPDFAPAAGMSPAAQAPAAPAAAGPVAPVQQPNTVTAAIRSRLAPQVGHQRIFPNGRVGVWDGKGWAHQGGGQ